VAAATAETSATAHVAAAHSSTHMAAAATVAATATTATARECGCRRHGAAKSESYCKNHHNLTQHDKPPSRMLSASAMVSGIAIGRPPDMCVSSRRRVNTSPTKPTSTK